MTLMAVVTVPMIRLPDTAAVHRWSMAYQQNDLELEWHTKADDARA